METKYCGMCGKEMPLSESVCSRCAAIDTAGAEPESGPVIEPSSEEIVKGCDFSETEREADSKKPQGQLPSDVLPQAQEPTQRPLPAYLTSPIIASSSDASKPASSSEPSYRKIQPKNAVADTLTIADYFGMLILSAIPFAGFIILLVWAFGGTAGENRRNFSKALLLLKVVLWAVSIVFFFIISIAMYSIGSMGIYY